MKKRLYILVFIIGFCSCSNGQSKNNIDNNTTDSIIKLKMYLSAFGVESDGFPSIDVVIDFSKDTSICVKSYYHPAYKRATYSLTKSEMELIYELLKNTDIEKLKTEYTVEKTDQPTSTITIYTTKKTFVIEDYGLVGEYPLQELYEIVYKF